MYVSRKSSHLSIYAVCRIQCESSLCCFFIVFGKRVSLGFCQRGTIFLYVKFSRVDGNTYCTCVRGPIIGRLRCEELQQLHHWHGCALKPISSSLHTERFVVGRDVGLLGVPCRITRRFVWIRGLWRPDKSGSQNAQGLSGGACYLRTCVFSLELRDLDLFLPSSCASKKVEVTLLWQWGECCYHSRGGTACFLFAALGGRRGRRSTTPSAAPVEVFPCRVVCKGGEKG